MRQWSWQPSLIESLGRRRRRRKGKRSHRSQRVLCLSQIRNSAGPNLPFQLVRSILYPAPNSAWFFFSTQIALLLKKKKCTESSRIFTYVCSIQQYDLALQVKPLSSYCAKGHVEHVLLTGLKNACLYLFKGYICRWVSIIKATYALFCFCRTKARE